jgi:NTE family protein
MKRALVLSGGGNVGVAWETAALAGLMDGGVDVRDADLIIGTSAGSVVGTSIAHGRDPRELLRLQREEPPRPLGNGPTALDTASAAQAFQLWATFDTMTEDACAQVGRIALGATTMAEADWIAGFAQNDWPGWPQKQLLITAVDAESGEFRAIDSTQGVPIDVACAASCAVPALFPTVTIDGRRYTDGGVRSFTSADLANRIQPDVVLIVAVFGVVERGVHAIAARQLAGETAGLEAAGASVRTIRMDAAAIEASGMNLMDPTRRGPTADAGERHGRKLGAELAEWWSG